MIGGLAATECELESRKFTQAYLRIGTVPAGQSSEKMVAKGRPIRSANQDAQSAPRRGKDRQQVDPHQSNCRHADFRACKYLILLIISTSYRGVRCAICSTMQDYSGPNHAKFTQEKLSDSHHKIRSKLRSTGLPRVALRIADYSGFE